MKRVLLATILLVILSEGTGIHFFKKFKAEPKGFAAPVGFAVLLGTMQLFYYPVQLFNLSFFWIKFISSAVLTAALFFTVKHRKEVVQQFCHVKTLWVIAAFVIFCVFLYQSSIDLDFSDSATYINYVAQNINAKHINLFDLNSGIKGEEWDLYYLFQGFYHFSSYFTWLVNIPYYAMGHSAISTIVCTVWGMGALYNILSSMLIINVIRYFHLRNRLFEAVLFIFTLFYTNFTYWNISYAFYGNTFRNLFIILALFYIYRWIRESNDGLFGFLSIIFMAGLASSSSYLFMGFAIVYGLAYYLFREKYTGSLKQLLILVTPLVFYAGAFISRALPIGSAVVYIGWILFLIVLITGKLNRFITTAELFFMKHSIGIFILGIPAIFAIGTLVLNVTGNAGDLGYSWYFHNFLQMDMIHDYLFVYSSWQDNIVNVIRWIGVVLLFVQAKSEEDRWVRDFMLCMFVFFLNPLCVTMICKTFTGMVFYRNWITLFNFFTETICFIYIYRSLFMRKGTILLLSVVMFSLTVYVNLCDFLPMIGNGMHYVYFNEQDTKNINGIEKISDDEKNALLTLQGYIEAYPSDSQPTVISQTNALISYMPDVYQVFTSHDYRVPEDRIDEDLYQMARYHYVWEGEDTTDYTNACSLLTMYDVDYIVMQYNDNRNFDYASDACFDTIYSNDTWKVKVRN